MFYAHEELLMFYAHEELLMFYAHEEHVLINVSTWLNESTSKFEHSHLLKRVDNR